MPVLSSFRRKEKAKGRQAWQRLQMVKAIEFYQNAVLGAKSPPLDATYRTGESRRGPKPVPERRNQLCCFDSLRRKERYEKRPEFRQLNGLLGRPYTLAPDTG